YDAFGNLTRRIAPNGHTWHYQYNAEHRLTEASLYHQAPAAGDDATPVTQAQYAYDGLGRRIYKRVKAPGAADRLTVFTWDGDLLQSEESFRGELPPTPYFYSPSEHPELTRENPERKHSIPIAQRQHSLATTPGITPERRVSYLFEPGSFIPAAKLAAHYKAIEQKTGSGTVLYTDHRLAEQTLYYFQTDHLGTPLELAGSDGNLAWIGQYRAWGKLTKATDGNGDPSTTDNPFRFQGQYHDEETGLHYNRFRYYDPEIGRFTTQDPIGLAGGTNLYQYAPNPTGWVDPLGLDVFDVGSYRDLRGAVRGGRTGLDAHHAGQKAIMRDLVSGYDLNTAPAILVPKEGHTLSREGVGIVSRSKINPTTGQPFDSPRDLLARDVKELRRVYPEAPNNQLQELIGQNKEMYPEMRRCRCPR
ncbi:RHS repeat-associated core domain-containing protein, partial [Halomonas sp. V046]|uniref:RHS repeat-associated core domain-containing protein n=1 Tax=Halomonas sp. V046 TaxID=3459611 RepID=UPI004044DA6C